MLSPVNKCTTQHNKLTPVQVPYSHYGVPTFKYKHKKNSLNKTIHSTQTKVWAAFFFSLLVSLEYQNNALVVFIT